MDSSAARKRDSHSKKAFRLGKLGSDETPFFTENERPRAVRRKKADLRTRVNQNIGIEFTAHGLTSYAGLELLIRYLRRTGFNGQLRRHLSAVVSGGDFGTVGLCRVILGLLVVGGRRLRHLGFLKGDPLLQRFCGLQALPTDRSVSRWLKRFTAAAEEALKRLNAEVVARLVGVLKARTLTIDVDGTVLCTGKKVGGACRGYNPHHRKVPSYYPITAYLADSGHFLRLHNRHGNVNDGASSIPFLQAVFEQIDETMGQSYRLRFRMDGDFFKEDVFKTLSAHDAQYAIKVPFWRCLDLQGQIRQRRCWQRVEDGVDGFFSSVTVNKWKRTFNVVIFRKRVMHATRKNYQLDLFDPDNGTWEYCAVATNLPFDTRTLWRFMGGRGMHEKAIGELKTGLAFDAIPTDDYQANSAWQQLVILAHNLLTNFQIETGLTPRNRTSRNTSRWALKSVRTLRFELFNRAGQLVRPQGKAALRLQCNEQAEKQFREIAAALRKAA
tara:strand:+ start:42 stop:1535 length:1494 start_codon:yes stop_codon:yes gene_type:complete